MDKLFYVFNLTRVICGTTVRGGLDLSMCRGIEEHHNCTIRVDIRPGPGTTFSFGIFVIIRSEKEEIKHQRRLMINTGMNFSQDIDMGKSVASISVV